MKKLSNILKKCVLALMIGLVISNIAIPSPDGLHPEPEVSVCAPTSEPIENPFGDQDYD